MRTSTIATTLLATALAVQSLPTLPTLNDGLSYPGLAGKLIGGVEKWWNGVDKGMEGVVQGMRVETLIMDGTEFQSLTHPSHPEYRLRVVSPTICDPDVKQYSGYLDISETKHLFFWFMESRNDPKEDPLMLWLNGGPGCSSTTGLLFELGACMVAKQGLNVTYNPSSWTSTANVIFLDQPVGVGFSYSDDEGVNNSQVAAEDVWAFLQLFVGNFAKYRKQDFHIAGESYAGTYIPNIASVIHNNNLALSISSNLLPKINFKSLLIGNGLTNAKIQFASVPEYACDSEYAVYDDPLGQECQSLRQKMKRCEGLVNTCYNTNSKFACVPAGLVCWSGFGQLQDLGLNMYDTRKKCDRAEDKDGPLCYKEMGWMETYLNRPEIKKELGAPSNIEFKSCNMDINKNFLFQGDAMHNSALLLPELIESGIRLLVYAGVHDLMCNVIGNEMWMNELETSYLPEFLNSTAEPFIDSDKKNTGSVRFAGEGAGNVAFMRVFGAGHMVPQDQPVAALDMVTRWIKNVPLAKGK